MLDFGPIYGFWCFSFERYNGMLGAINTNKRNIELQIMERFLRQNHVVNQEPPKPSYDILHAALGDLKNES